MREGTETGVRGGLCLSALLACAALLLFAPGASADLALCPEGEGADRCEDPSDVAVDSTAERVYLADGQNNRIAVYDPAGNFVEAFGWGVQNGSAEMQRCTTICLKGLSGSGPGQFKGSLALAVDEDPASPSHQALYVSEGSNFRVQKLDPLAAEPDDMFLLAFGWGVRDGSEAPQTCGPAAAPPSACLPANGGKGECRLSGRKAPVAIGPGGRVHVADSAQVGPSELEGFDGRVMRFGEDGACEDELSLFEAENRVLAALAVDSASNVYVYVERGAANGIYKYDPSGTLLCEIELGTATTALAVDGADGLHAAQGVDGRVLTRYGPECETESPPVPRRRYGYGQIADVASGLASFPSPQGDVFVSQRGNFAGPGFRGLLYLSEPPPGPVIAAPSPQAAPSNTKATLGAEVNPEGKATDVVLEYLTLSDFEAQGGFAGPATESIEAPLGGAADFRLHGVEELAGCPSPATEALEPENDCLVPETEYRWQVKASNPDGEGNGPIDGGAFTTQGTLELGSIWASGVGTDGALLSGEANPLGVPASGRFEYVTEAAYQADLAAGGDGFAAAETTAAVDFGAGEEFLTRAAPTGPLSPGTAYRFRLVAESPLAEKASEPGAFTTLRAKGPGEDACANDAFRAGPGALLPDCRAYELVSPLDKSGGDIYVLGEFNTSLPAALNQSSLTGSRLAYGTYRSFGDAPSAPYTTQYLAARGAGGWQSHSISPPRERRILQSVLPSLNTELKMLSPDLCEAWLRTLTDPPLDPAAQAGYPNLYRREDNLCGGPAYAPLTTAPWENLKAHEELAIKLELQGVSEDGTRALLSAPDSLAGSGAPNIGGVNPPPRAYVWTEGKGPVFACVLPDGSSLKGGCSGGATTLVGPGSSFFANVQGALSADGTRAFWTTGAGGPGEIYVREHPELGRTVGECESPAEPCTTAVSEEAEELSGTSSSQFLAAGTDGSRAIFMSGTDLYGFEVESKETTLIAGEAQVSPGSAILGTSADAATVYFASKEAIEGSGENSEGALPEPGEPNLYRFHEGAYGFIGTLAAADIATGATPIALRPTNRNSRVTPDGTHAAFMSAAPLTGYDNADAKSGAPAAEVFLYDAATGQLACASCNPSGGRPRGEVVGGHPAAAHLPVFQNTLYGARALSEDGTRLYFQAHDSLVAHDTNGAQDVYQWEQAGRGGCDASDPGHSPAAGGCVELISSGQSARDSEFVDADPDGSDVFFATLSSLLPHDYGLVDIYDAREGGGQPVPAPPRDECETADACQSPSPPPEAPSAASEGFAGPGDLPGPSPCARAARAAKRLAGKAKRARRASKRTARSKRPAKAKAMRKKSARLAKRARRRSRAAKRCRARARKARAAARSALR